MHVWVLPAWWPIDLALKKSAHWTSPTGLDHIHRRVGDGQQIGLLQRARGMRQCKEDKSVIVKIRTPIKGDSICRKGVNEETVVSTAPSKELPYAPFHAIAPIAAPAKAAQLAKSVDLPGLNAKSCRNPSAITTHIHSLAEQSIGPDAPVSPQWRSILKQPALRCAGRVR
jgi:hypothetical protein